MPIPDLVALGFTAKEDSKYLQEEPADPTIRHESEGGFVMTRARYTRAPTVTITTGWTDISDADKRLLMTFYGTVARGGAAAFSYVHPVSGDILTVRFKEPPRPKYAGVGATYRWDVPDVKLETI